MISKTGIHAIKALTVLAELPQGAYAGAGAIALQIGARQNYLGKLLQLLSHQGLVISQKGSGGGFRLGRQPDQIRLLDVVEPIDRVSRWGGCLMGRSRCGDDDPCAIHRRWAGVREAYMKFLTETTIAELAEQPVGEVALGKA
jgi:Rrf2 family transcriptional regulator, iron-sulfur cluster assembly transcription factor